MYSNRTAKSDLAEVTSNGANAIKDAQNTLSDTAHRAGQQIRHFIDSASSEVTHAKETVTQQIKDKPVQSSLMALGIGFVLGALLRR